MIVNSEEPNISGGMLIDWDLCKVINSQGEGSGARQYTHTVSQAHNMLGGQHWAHARPLVARLVASAGPIQGHR